jgi:hypothetical protein
MTAMLRMRRGRGLLRERSLCLKNLTWLVREMKVALLEAELKVWQSLFSSSFSSCSSSSEAC